MSRSMNPRNHVSRRMSLAILGSASVAAGCSREGWRAKQTNGQRAHHRARGHAGGGRGGDAQHRLRRGHRETSGHEDHREPERDFTRTTGKAVM